jgi:hypothetical protein
VGGRGVGGPIGQVYLQQRESAQYSILTCHQARASGQKEGTQ